MIYAIAAIVVLILLGHFCATPQDKLEAKRWSDSLTKRLTPFIVITYLLGAWLILDAFGPVAGTIAFTVVAFALWSFHRRYWKSPPPKE